MNCRVFFVSNHVDPCYELFNWCKSITQFNKGGRKSSKGHRGMPFGLYDLPNGVRSIFEGLFYLHQELFLLSTADLYLRTIAHHDDTTFTPYVFFHMQHIDEKRFMDTKEDIAQQPVIVEQGLRYQKGFVVREMKDSVASFRFTVHHLLQLHDRETSLRRQT